MLYYIEEILLITYPQRMTDIKNLKSKDVERRCKLSKVQNYSSQGYKELRAELDDDYLYFSAYEFFMDKHKRVSTGAVYTPEWIVTYMVQTLLDDYQLNRSNLWDIKILEHSCGTGNFIQVLVTELLTRLQYLYPDKSISEITRHIVENMIHAWDINTEAVRICIERVQSIFHYTPKHIQAKNTLYQSGQFDIIIGNPPYGNILNKDDKKTLHDRYGNIALSFISKTLELLNDDGVSALIVPHSFTRTKTSYSEWRKEMYDYKFIYKVVDVGNPFWDITLEEVIFYFSKKENDTVSTSSFKDPHLSETVSIEQFYNKTENYKMNLYYDAFFQHVKELNPIYPFSGRRGADLRKSELGPSEGENMLWFILGKNITKNGTKRVPNYDRYISHEKIEDTYKISTEVVAITQFGTNLKACLLDSSMYPSGGVVIVESEGITQEDAIEYLNDKIINYFLIRYILNNASLTVHMDGIYLESIPYIDRKKLHKLYKEYVVSE